MASRILLLSLSCLVLFSGSFARHQQSSPLFNECQLDNLDALPPDNHIKSEAGVTEIWDHIHPQFRCVGVAVLKRTIHPNGLHLPSYTNTHQLHYVVRGYGLLGLSFPGCAETFEGSQQGEGGSQRRDRHQKIREFRQGDIIAIPAGVAYWTYNNGDSPLVVVSLLDVGNNANQLDQNPRRFYLAGNPEEEHRQQGRRQGQQQEDTSNLFNGFDREFLAQVFDNMDIETIRKLQGEKDDRRNIVRVQGRLQYLSPRREEGREEYERDSDSSRVNGLEETLCAMKLRQNIDNPERADIVNPQAGRITTVNGFDLPILNMLQLSAERVKLYRNGIFVPHWSNAHSIMYVTRGRGRVQVVDDQGNSVFNREVREGEILTVPQNFAMAKQAGEEGFECVVFKTRSNAKCYPLIGRTSVLRAMPEDVIANAFQVRGHEARNIKFNVEETFLVSGRELSEAERVEGYIKL